MNELNYKKLKEIMQTQNISQLDLANAIGKSKSSVSQYLSGITIPNINTLKSIASFLNVDIKDLKHIEDMEDDNTSVSVTYTAKRIGKTPQFVRLALQQGTAPFGFAVKNTKDWSYHISLKKLNEYIGV